MKAFRKFTEEPRANTGKDAERRGKSRARPKDRTTRRRADADHRISELPGTKAGSCGKEGRVCRMDVTKYEKMRGGRQPLRSCRRDAYTILQSELQEQLREIKRKTGFRYARIWNILSRRNVSTDRTATISGNWILFWTSFWKTDGRRIWNWGINRRCLCIRRSGRAEMEEQGMYTYDTFQGIIRALCVHLANRYGAEELERWYFEYWNDPKHRIAEEDGTYFPYFEVIYRTLKSISPEIRVGGASLS